MTPSDPLAQLRDIHVPDAIGSWPPAPGWWLLAIALLFALFMLLQWLWRHYDARAYRREALRNLNEAHEDWLESGQTAPYFSAVNELLKRVAMQTYGRQRVASLSGARWLAFLDRTAHRLPHEFSATAMDSALYSRDDTATKPDVVNLLAREWIKHHRSDAC